MEKQLNFDSSHSNSQMLLENSDWLAENVKGLDQNVEDMMQLIKQDDAFLDYGNSDKQHELIAYIKEISLQHHLLSDRYKKLTGEFSNYLQTENGIINGFEKSSVGPQSPSLVTPDKKIQMPDAEVQVVDSDLSLSSGSGISDTTPNEGSESSYLLSDSDSETYYQTPYEHSLSRSHAKTLKHEIADLASEASDVENVMTKQGYAYESKGAGESGEYEMLVSRISKYEQESTVSNLKLQLAEEEIAKLKNQLQHNEAALSKYEQESTVSNLKLKLAEEENTKLKNQLQINEAAMVKMGSLEAELVSAKNKIKLHEAEVENENSRSLVLQGQIVDLETKLEAEKKKVQDLKDVITKYSTNLSDRDFEIQKLETELQDNTGSFALEKWQLESCISRLQENLSYYETRSREFEIEIESLHEKNKNSEAEKLEMERNQEALRKKWEDYTAHAEAELCKRNELIDTINENLEGLNLKYDQLSAERDEIQTKLQCVMVEQRVYNDQIQTIEQNGRDLQSEKKQLVSESEGAKKLISGLNSRIEELEKELGMQSIVISERADEKREAIRQLCFSIDHYKSAYEELRDAYLMHRQRRALV